MNSVLRALAGPCASLVLLGCERPAPVESPPARASAASVVREFFAGYRGNFREADAVFLSQGLAAALQSVAEGEKESAARVKASDFPNDKPQILEGEVFAGLYEGYTTYEVAGERAGEGSAVVEVRFRNAPYGVAWTDEIVVVDENGWKIDDVRYSGKKAGLLSLREVLQDFEAAVVAEAAALSSTP
jgi:hypothetical protein